MSLSRSSDHGPPNIFAELAAETEEDPWFAFHSTFPDHEPSNIFTELASEPEGDASLASQPKPPDQAPPNIFTELASETEGDAWLASHSRSSDQGPSNIFAELASEADGDAWLAVSIAGTPPRPSVAPPPSKRARKGLHEAKHPAKTIGGGVTQSEVELRSRYFHQQHESQQLKATPPQLKATPPQLKAAPPQMKAAPPRLKATPPRLKATPPQLKAAPPQLKETSPQRKAKPQTTDAGKPVTGRPRRPLITLGPAMSTQEVMAGLERRRRKLAEIDAALKRWTPSLHVDESSQLSKQGLDAAGRANIEDMVCERVKNQPSLPEGTQHVSDAYQEAAVGAAQRGESFFLTGSAGTGKSYVLQRIIQQLRRRGRKVAVTASTGCAAVAIHGCTIHSFASVGLGLDPIEELRAKARCNPTVQRKLRNPDVLVIDEISMIDSFLFDKIEAVCTAARSSRQDRGKKRGKEMHEGGRRDEKDEDAGAERLFGGLQVIVCGDFLQLPPVAPSEARLQRSKEKYFAFESKVWKKAIKTTFVLRTVHRQDERAFVGMLNEMRYGVVSMATERVLKACYINRHDDNTELDEKGNEMVFTKLYSFRAQVHAENWQRLNRIQSRGVKFQATDWYAPREERGILTYGAVKNMVNSVVAGEVVSLKVGARVICLKNVDASMGIVNGSGGTVIGFKVTTADFVKQRENFVKMGMSQRAKRPDLCELASVDGLRSSETVMLDDAEVQTAVGREGVDEDGFILQSALKACVIPVVQYDIGVTRSMAVEMWDVYGLHGQPIASRSQIPLTLGWALSIHKAQGMTLGCVETDVKNAFDYGQVYVALSRATCVRGLRLGSFDRSKVKSHHKVVRFYEGVDEVATRACGAREEEREEEGEEEGEVQYVQ